MILFYRIRFREDKLSKYENLEEALNRAEQEFNVGHSCRQIVIDTSERKIYVMDKEAITKNELENSLGYFLYQTPYLKVEKYEIICTDYWDYETPFESIGFLELPLIHEGLINC